MTTETKTPAPFRRIEDGRSPLVVNFGGGVDSTAILVRLVEMFEAGDATARPDLVLFADTGSELPETYENVARVSAYLELHGFPRVTTVSRPANIPGRAGYRTLEENCLVNETLPGEAFGRGNCSCKWKHEPMDAFLHGRQRPLRAGWLELHGFAGEKPVKLIGYDATETLKGKRGASARENLEDATAKYRYPLVEWGWTRERCEQAIRAAGLPSVVKSACFFCPNQTTCELRAMAESSPALVLRALVIEEVARRGKHGLQIEGLWRRTRKSDGRSGSWVEWARAEGLLEKIEAAVGCTLEQAVLAAKPEWAPVEIAAA
jgi:hypothetical protein